MKKVKLLVLLLAAQMVNAAGVGMHEALPEHLDRVSIQNVLHTGVLHDIAGNTWQLVLSKPVFEAGHAWVFNRDKVMDILARNNVRADLTRSTV